MTYTLVAFGSRDGHTTSLSNLFSYRLRRPHFCCLHREGNTVQSSYMVSMQLHPVRLTRDHGSCCGFCSCELAQGHFSAFPFSSFPTACMSTDVGNVHFMAPKVFSVLCSVSHPLLSPDNAVRTYILRAWRGIHGCSHTIRTQARVKPSHGSSPAGSAAKKWYIT